MLKRAFAVAEAWTSLEMSGLSHLPPAAVAFGSGAGWAAALETALLLKEVAGIPAEGVETREGATSSMYALREGHLVLSIGAADDPLLREAAEVCESAGASVIRLPSGEIDDERLLPLLSFPTSVAVAIALGTRAGMDVDAPAWLQAYARTARGVPVGLEAAS
jgi:fructoselysine-6-P-deglycase FrlB-like protein